VTTVRQPPRTGTPTPATPAGGVEISLDAEMFDAILALIRAAPITLKLKEPA